MDHTQRVVCLSKDLQEKGSGIRFDLSELGDRVTGFALRFNGRVYAYINQCAHVPVELDWNEGDFFNLTRDYLICATHGAQYDPTNGYCVIGPCKGKRLIPLMVSEQAGQVLIDLGTAVAG